MTPGEDLLTILRRRIELRGRIPFSEFMAAALYEPGLGRYCRPRPPMGPEGDYVTSPEVDEAFGRLLGRGIREMWESTGGPGAASPFTIVEAGPGRGTLCRDLLSGLAAEAPALHGEVRYVLVESSGSLRAGQQALLRSHPAAAGRAAWWDWRDLLEGPPIRGCVLANEFLDALPVHLVERSGGRLVEIWVGLDGGGDFVEVAAEPSRPEIEAYFRRLGITLAEGQRAEVNLEAIRWVREAARLIATGYAVIIDYGHEASELFSEAHFEGTLLGYRRHRLSEDPLADPGDQDLTSHVDFTSVREAALGAGFTAWAMTSQRNLLVSMGLAEMIASLPGPREGGSAEALGRRFALHTLMSPSGMGGTFKALILGRDAPVAGLRLAGNPFRGAVEGPGGGVYDNACERAGSREPSGVAPSRPRKASAPNMSREPSRLDAQALRGLLASAPSRAEGIRAAVEAIRASNPAYHWAGVYLLEGEELVLAHQIGKPTPHERIPLDRGICGAAAREGRTLVVDDVRADPRYLACSLETRSEIVVLIKGGDGRILGEIDIDSDLPSAFDGEDRRSLEQAADLLGSFFESHDGTEVRAPRSPAAPPLRTTTEGAP